MRRGFRSSPSPVWALRKRNPFTLMWEERLKSRPHSGFSLIELMVVLVISSVVIGGIYTFVGRQRKMSTFQRLRADTESIAQISYFIIGRDIRRAGSNPAGALGYEAGAE